jgi:hypothetical protein
LSSAGNKLIDTVKDLTLNGHQRWENGDEACIELFGGNSVPQAKEFTHRVMHDLCRLGRSYHRRSSTANIDTKRFDPWNVPRFKGLQATIEDGKHENNKSGDNAAEVVQEEVIKNEEVSPSPQHPVFPDTERKSFPSIPKNPSTELTQHKATNSFKTPTVPRPADYKTPPRGPSFSPITPPAHPAAEATNDATNAAPSHPPLQHEAKPAPTEAQEE